MQTNAKLFVVEHAGHYPWLEDPAGTATALRAVAGAMPWTFPRIIQFA